jgi:hypothetical protein
MRDGCTTGEPGVLEAYPVGRNVMALAEGSDGALWAGSVSGLLRMLPGGSGSFQRLTRSQGLTDRSITSLATDRAGNLWAGTEGAGAMMMEPAGFTTFHEQDGLTSDRVWSVLGDRTGKILAVAHTEDLTAFSMSVFDGAGFHIMQAPKVFAMYHNHRAWGSHRILLESLFKGKLSESPSTSARLVDALDVLRRIVGGDDNPRKRPYFGLTLSAAEWKNTLPWHLGPAAKVRIFRFKIFRHSGMILVFKTTFEVFTRVGPDNSLERLTERSVGLVTDQPSDVYELFVTLL